MRKLVSFLIVFLFIMSISVSFGTEINGLYVIGQKGSWSEYEYNEQLEEMEEKEYISLIGILEDCDEVWAADYVQQDNYLISDECELPQEIDGYYPSSQADSMIVWARIVDGVVEEIEELVDGLTVSVSSYGNLLVKELTKNPINGSKIICKNGDEYTLSGRALVENVVLEKGLNYLNTTNISTNLTDCYYSDNPDNDTRFNDSDKFDSKSFVMLDHNNIPVIIYRTIKDFEINGLYVVVPNSIEMEIVDHQEVYSIELKGIFEDCDEVWCDDYLAYDKYFFSGDYEIPEFIDDYFMSESKTPLYVWARIKDGIINEIREFEDGLSVDLSGYEENNLIKLLAPNPYDDENKTLTLDDGTVIDLYHKGFLVYDTTCEIDLVNRTITNVETELKRFQYNNNQYDRLFEEGIKFNPNSYIVLNKGNAPIILFRTEIVNEIQGIYLVTSSTQQFYEEDETKYTVSLEGILENCSQSWADEYVKQDEYFFSDTEFIPEALKTYYYSENSVYPLFVWAKICNDEIIEAKVIEQNLAMGISSYGENLTAKMISDKHPIIDDNKIVDLSGDAYNILSGYLIGDVTIHRTAEFNNIASLTFDCLNGKKDTYSSGDIFEEHSFIVVDNYGNVMFIFRLHDYDEIYGLYTVVSKEIAYEDNKYHVDLDGILEEIEEDWAEQFLDKDDYVFSDECEIPANILSYQMEENSTPLLVWAHIINGEIQEISKFEDGMQARVSLYGETNNYLREIEAGYPVSGDIIVDKNGNEYSIHYGHNVCTIYVTRNENGITNIKKEYSIGGRNQNTGLNAYDSGDYFGEGSYIYTVGDMVAFTFRVVEEFEKGDLDNNSSIDIIDVRLLLQAFINSNDEMVWTEQQLAIMDMDLNGTINIIDVRLLLQAYINN